MKTKILYLTILFFSFYHNSSQAQHKISAYGGWTAAKIQVYSNPNTQKSPIDQELFAFPILHKPYVAFEYEYDWKKLRLSTGLSTTIWGTSASWGGSLQWAEMYLNIPTIAGFRFDLPKNWNITLESGLETGIRLTPLGVYHIDDFEFRVRINVNAILGLEANWKQFRLGTRLQVGLTTFRRFNDDIWFKHSGITTYIGYTIWDSQIAKEKRAKRLAKKQADKI
ncbi:MAG: hypothetical protein JKY03_08405 [Aureispira sp.]|nr:hypothetical protein [Aureispira sp.]